MRTATQLAVAAVRRAEGFADTGEPTDKVLHELQAAQAETTDLERHTRLLVDLEEILRQHADYLGGRMELGPTAQRMGSALRTFGLDVNRQSVDQVARQVVASRIRDKLLGFFADWSFQSTNALEKQRLREVLRSAWKSAGGTLARWQDLVDRGDVARMNELAVSPEVLALAPELIGAIGRDLRNRRAHQTRLVLMRKAAEKYPDAVWLQYDAYEASFDQNPPLLSDALRYAAACVTLKPRSAFFRLCLANTYHQLKELDLALDASLRAVGLLPNNSAAHRRCGLAYAAKKDYEQAIACWARALEYGPEKDRSMLENDLAKGLAAGHRSGKTVSGAVEGSLRRLSAERGSDNPVVLKVQHSLARACWQAGLEKEASPLLEDCLRRRQKVLGATHGTTLWTMSDLAWVYRSLGRHAEAVPVFRGLWKARQASLPSGDRMTIDTENHLGWTLVLAGDYAQAEVHLINSRRDLGRARGVPPDWLSIYHSRLATLYQRWGKADEASRWRKAQADSLRDWMRAPPSPGWDRKGVLTRIGAELLPFSAEREAEPTLRELVAGWKQESGSDWRGFFAQGQLGVCLANQGREKDAEPLLLAAYQGLTARQKEIPVEHHPFIASTADRLARLYEAWGKPVEAARWRNERKKYASPP
jgi:tetratricopeptide (TPR) repeat protein